VVLNVGLSNAFKSGKKPQKEKKKKKNQYLRLRNKKFLHSFASLKRSTKKKELTERSLKGSQLKESEEHQVLADKSQLKQLIENPNIVDYLFENLISKVDLIRGHCLVIVKVKGDRVWPGKKRD
jgi:hypothetical protein